jgi:hypothetical protein
MPDLPQGLAAILQGDPFGRTFPPKPAPPPLPVDGRTVALRILQQYVCALVFYLPMGAGRPPRPFRMKPENFNIEWPDYVQDAVFPSITVMSGLADYGVIGLTAYVEEATRDLYGKGTVLQWQAEYTEHIKLEIRASKRAERRAILAALETAFSPTEQMTGVRFKMPDYFNELVCFTLWNRILIDEPDAARNRRKAQVELEMRFNIVALVNYVPFQPTLASNTDINEDTQIAINLTDDPNAVQGPG